jgi:hypothetical protein
VILEILPSPRLSYHPEHVERAEFRQQKLVAWQLPLGLGTINRVKLLQRGQQPRDIFPISGMDHVDIEGGNRSAVKHRADPAHYDKFNAMPGQDFQYFEEPGIRTLHGA